MDREFHYPLERRRAEAVERLAMAEAARRGVFGLRGKPAADRIRRSVKEIESRIAQAHKQQAKISGSLAEARAKLEKYESRKLYVSGLMAFPEMEGLQPIKRRATVEHQPTAEGAEIENDRLNREWSVSDFLKTWNTTIVSGIKDPAAFNVFADAWRSERKMTGATTLGQLLDVAWEYQKSVGSGKGFAKDRRFFLQGLPNT